MSSNVSPSHPAGWIEDHGTPGAGKLDTEFVTIGELAREFGISLRALRFYQSKGLLAPRRSGHARVYNHQDRERLVLILQGKRLGFTLSEIGEMIAKTAAAKVDQSLPMSRKKCIKQINMLEQQQRDLVHAIAELRRIYTAMSMQPGWPNQAARSISQ